ncbi:hypothetical protein EV715DRAFT_273949 [Schizophyllum commune]
MSVPRRVALVTGAAQGLGKAIALRLAKDGHHVGLNDLPSKKAVLEDVAHQVEQHGVRASVFTGDVTKENDVRATIDGAADALGGLHVMVANAGILLPAPFLDETLQSFNRVTSVSSTGTFLCYQHAGRRMIKEGHGEGRIIGASSFGGKRPLPGLTSYVAAKYAVRGMTSCAALALGKYGITVNAYAPGLADTPMAVVDGMKEHAGITLESWAKSFAIPRHTLPADIAALVSFLASKEAGYITGIFPSMAGPLWIRARENSARSL